MSNTSNLYRDILDLYKFYTSNEGTLSKSFFGLIRMSLRLLCELATKEDNKKKLEKYLLEYFEKAKLDEDKKTALSNHNVHKDSIVQLLHTGAHAYTSSHNKDQTILMSIIIGEILTISHGREKA